MNDQVQTSCWTVAAKGVALFAVVLFVAWLVGGSPETAAVVAAG